MQAVSIVFFTDTWRPDSFYARIRANRQRGLHTLCLLDIKVHEPSLESLARGRKVISLTPQISPPCVRCMHAVCVSTGKGALLCCPSEDQQGTRVLFD
jgi:diphthamide biosynthesis methyltransferase